MTDRPTRDRRYYPRPYLRDLLAGFTEDERAIQPAQPLRSVSGRRPLLRDLAGQLEPDPAGSAAAPGHPQRHQGGHRAPADAGYAIWPMVAAGRGCDHVRD